MTDSSPAELDRKSLGTLQRWMQTVITHPEGVESGVKSAPAQTQFAITEEQIETVIRRSQSLTSRERLNVYANAYFSRLLECLREEFSAVVHAAGEDGFNALAFAYLQEFPSSSYTLADLGKEFPRHLAETRPPRETDDDTPDWIDFLIDLARLERLYGDIFDGPGIEQSETLQLDDLLAIPPARWPHVRFAMAPCLRLVTFRFPVEEYASAVRNLEADTREEIPIPEPAETFLAVSRIRFRVRRWSLSVTEYRLLKELMAGNTLQDSIATAFIDSDRTDDEIAADLRKWFEEWASAGFIISVNRD